MTAGVETIETASPAETEACAAVLARRLGRGAVLALAGDLGAGKTCFVRGLAAGLGLDPRRVSSPTFVLLQEYAHPGTARRLAHLDAWRLAGPDDLDAVGWEELLDDPDLVVAIEWPERVAARLPARAWRIAIEHLDAARRRIVIEPPPAPA